MKLTGKQRHVKEAGAEPLPFYWRDFHPNSADHWETDPETGRYFRSYNQPKAGINLERYEEIKDDKVTVAESGDGFSSQTRTWIFPYGASSRQVYRWLVKAGIALRGWSNPPSAYDCTGRVSGDPIRANFIGGHIIVMQHYSRDV